MRATLILVQTPCFDDGSGGIIQRRPIKYDDETKSRCISGFFVFLLSDNGLGKSYLNPHTFRNSLVRLGETICQSPEAFKAWSQNLCHEDVLTTFCSYDEVSSRRQQEILEGLGSPTRSAETDFEKIAKAVAQELRKSKMEAGSQIRKDEFKRNDLV
jgi:hypothetical protein